MKTNRLIAIMALGAMLIATPAMAQGRSGGSRGGGSHSSSSSSSRSGGGHSSYSGSSSRSSSSSSSHSSFSSSSSRSSSSSPSSRSSYSSPSSSRSSSVSRPSSSERRGSTGYRSDVPSRHSAVGNPSSSNPVNRSSRSEMAPSRSMSGDRTHDRTSGRGNGNPQAPGAVSGNNGRGTVHPQNAPGHTYARPGQPGPMPPSHRPMHPAPYFHHPYHHHMIHMHPIIWHPVPPRPIFWPGFWLYCNSYWYDYHVTDAVVVHKYVRDTYNVDMVSYAISGDLMYAIVNDTDGKTYMQVFDQNDKLIAEQEISSKYIKTEIDRENGGCWIFKKKDKDPMLFLYSGGELLIYEAD